jgi:hypothetical protein
MVYQKNESKAGDGILVPVLEALNPANYPQ